MRSRGYARVGAKFRIALMTFPDDDLERASYRPWSDCSREEKLESLPWLPRLIVVLTEEVDEKATRAEKTLKAVSALLPAININDPVRS